MNETVRRRLDEQFDAHSIVRPLHDVPPHEVYEVTVDGRRAVYKGDTAATGNAGVEGRATAFVREHTSVPVPEIIHVADDYYVAAWHPDAPAPDEGQAADETWASAAGRGLATLHAETADVVERYGQFRPAGESVAVSGHDTWHAAALEYVRRRRPVLARHGHADVADDVAEFLREHPDAFADAGEAVCCHGWATPEHVAVDDGHVACVVDFEHVLAAPGEFDYWRVTAPTFDSESEDARRAFRDGYESVRSLPPGFDRRERLYGLLNLVYYFESLYVQDQHDPDETRAIAERFRSHVTETLATLSEG